MTTVYYVQDEQPVRTFWQTPDGMVIFQIGDTKAAAPENKNAKVVAVIANDLRSEYFNTADNVNKWKAFVAAQDAKEPNYYLYVYGPPHGRACDTKSAFNDKNEDTCTDYHLHKYRNGNTLFIGRRLIEEADKQKLKERCDAVFVADNKRILPLAGTNPSAEIVTLVSDLQTALYIP
jgi:hypothetical protein